MLSKKWETFMREKRPALVSSSDFNPAFLRRHIDVEASPAELPERRDFFIPDHPVKSLFENLAGRGLFLGSSLSVRLAQKFAPIVGPVDILSNRGASGIDGAISTAFGFSQKLRRGVVALIGDLTFLYDLNALALLKEAPFPITLVVLNNGGGGIFSALPLPSSEKARQLIETPHALQLQEAAKLFGLTYTTDLISGLKSQSSGIIEVFVETTQQIKELTYEFSGNPL